jgi:hypothetical protein
MWEKINAWKLWGASLKERDHMDDLGVSRRIILKRIINKANGRRGVDYSGTKQGKERWFCKLGNKLSDSIKCEKFLD